MSLKVGIVGLANVGKSTLFNALLKKQQAYVANYPFATIEPNVGIVNVPDERLAQLAKVANSGRIVPATVEFVDIAGLVAGAAKGAGLGNKFLAHIREVDVIVQLMRDFKDENIIREGSTDPKSDYEVVKDELILKDLETIEKLKAEKPKNPSAALRTSSKYKFIDKLFEWLDSGKVARDLEVNDEEKEWLRDLCLLTAKKELKVLNVAEDDIRLKNNDNSDLIICAKMEAELAALSEEEAKQYLQELGIKQSGLEKLIKKAYEALDLISFLTAGEMEAKAWTIRRGMLAPQAAGVIHTDFIKKFIKAKVVDYQDFIDFNGWKGAAEKGKVRLEGKEYVMKEGDVVEFMVGS